MAKLRSDLSRIAAQMPESAREALLQTATDIVSVAKQLSPVDTGALRQSIGADPVSPTTILIGSDLEYAKFQEYGTSSMAAQPFLTPAFVQSEETFRIRLAEAAKKVVTVGV